MRYFFENQQEDSRLYLYTMGYEENEASHSWKETTRSGYMLHYLREGNGTFTCQGKIYQLKKGDFFFIEPNTVIKYTADSQTPSVYFWIGFRGSLVKDYLRRTSINKNSPIFNIENGGNAIKDKMSEILEFCFVSENNDLLLNAKLLEILYLLSKNYPSQHYTKISRSKNELLGKAILMMRSNLDTNIQISEIANALSIDRTYLHRIFKVETGTSPKEYLNQLKLNQAKNLLSNSRLPINVVANSVGFDDPQNFSKFFKEKTKETPLQYRNSD